jgi:predicted phosphodiesterase
VLPIKTVAYTVDRGTDEIELHILADLHLGDRHCDEKLVREQIDHIKNTDNAYLILNGDILNWASKMSVSDVYAETLSPMEQIKRYTELFEPVKDKIIAMTQGNHEARAYRTEGVDLTQIVARQLGIEERYSAESCVIFLRVGGYQQASRHGEPVPYTIFCNHGSGGGRKEGAKAIRLADMASIVDADIYIHSHTHMPMAFRQSFYRVCLHNSSVQKVDRLFVNTAAALEYGGYGEAQEYKPASPKTPVLRLSGRRKVFDALV